jgi:hypothetical protein
MVCMRRVYIAGTTSAASERVRPEHGGSIEAERRGVCTAPTWPVPSPSPLPPRHEGRFPTYRRSREPTSRVPNSNALPNDPSLPPTTPPPCQYAVPGD